MSQGPGAAATALISVVMAVYNGARYLGEAVDSILGQTMRELEFVIIDDASTDETAAILAAYADPRMVRLRNPSNVGLTRSLNRGIRAARGQYIARQDADDVSLPGRLARQSEYLARHPAVALVGTGCRWIDAEGKPFRDAIFLTEPAQIQETLLQTPSFLHGTFMLRRECLGDLEGGYREFFPVAQDYDLLLRLSERWELANVGEVQYLYRVHADTVSARRKADQERYGQFARQDAIRRRLGYGRRRLGLSRQASPAWVDAASRPWLAQRFTWWSAAARMLNKRLALKFLMLALLLDPLNRTGAEYMAGIVKRKVGRTSAPVSGATVSSSVDA